MINKYDERSPFKVSLLFPFYWVLFLRKIKPRRHFVKRIISKPFQKKTVISNLYNFYPPSEAWVSLSQYSFSKFNGEASKLLSLSLSLSLSLFLSLSPNPNYTFALEAAIQISLINVQIHWNTGKVKSIINPKNHKKKCLNLSI